MDEERQVLFRIGSLLLHYPDEELLRSLGSLGEILGDLPPHGAAAKFREFVDYLGKTPLLRAQEEYTRAFDFAPLTCLNLTYHRWGEGKERGEALLDLKHTYFKGGYEMGEGELPDYLPLVMEFIAVGGWEDTRRIMKEYAGSVAALAERSHELGSPYADLLEGVERLFCADAIPGAIDDGNVEPSGL